MDPTNVAEGESTAAGLALQRPLHWGGEAVTSVTRDVRFALPTGIVTLLLADIEGSSRIWEASSTTMPATLARHDEIVNETLERFGGVRPSDQGEGDSFLAAFSRPSDALACALSIQRAFIREEWIAERLRLRIAIHTGEVQLRDEGNYIGQTINRCARIRDAAHGGQVLLSQATYDLVCDRLPNDVTLKDLGTHRLRDLARPERIHQMCHAELENDFGSLRTLDETPNNLPAQLTSFVGRRDELVEIRGLLAETRLLTLTGMGGSGKTRLALQLAADVLEGFPDGAWVADLSASTEPGSIAKGIGAAFRLRSEDRSFAETIATYIGSQRMLLVLDNCEHLIASCAEIADALLKSCPSLTIVTTSREPLGVPGETAWSVPPLSVPDVRTTPLFERLSQFDAVALFIERAAKVRPNFRVTNENAPAIAEICQRLDGIPLAIELAAARVRVLTPKQIVDGLHDRFRLLTGGSRIAVPRQQTLQASVDWSYGLLSDDERAVLRRLSVFVGGCTLDAAEAVCSDEALERGAILEVLSRLVDRSLVLMEEADGDGRYRLLQTIHDYSRDRLTESGEASVVRGRHRSTYFDFALATSGATYGEADASLLRLEADHANLQAALEWSRQTDTDALVKMTVALMLFWILRWHGAVGRLWGYEALALTQDQPSEARARLLLGLGYLELGGMNLAPVPALVNESLEIYTEIGDASGQAGCLALLGTMYVYMGDTTNGLAPLMEGAQLARSVLDEASLEDATSWSRTLAHISLAVCLESQGYAYIFQRPPDHARAKQFLDEALIVARAGGFEDIARRALRWLGLAEYMAGEYRRATPFLEAAVASAREGRNLPMLGSAAAYLGWALLWQGRYDEAVACFDEAAQMPRLRTDDDDWEQLARGWIEYRQGRYAAGAGFFRGVLDTASEPGTRAWATAYLARVEADEGYPDRAREHVSTAREMAVMGMEDLMETYLSGAEARLAITEGDVAAAQELGHAALASAVLAGSATAIGDALETLSCAAVADGRLEDAARIFACLGVERVRTGQALGIRERERLDAAVSSIREALGADAFDVAWAEGEGMSSEGAIVYVQRGRGTRKRPAHGWRSLTPTELEVTKHVAAGLKNTEIAERMFISRNTVETHLKHIFAKLDLTSRTELALEATKRDPDHR